MYENGDYSLKHDLGRLKLLTLSSTGTNPLLYGAGGKVYSASILLSGTNGK